MSLWKKCFETANSLDKELEGTLGNKDEIFKKFGKCSDYFKDLYETNLRFRESIKRITDLKKANESSSEPKNMDFKNESEYKSSESSSYETDEELPFEDKAKAFVMRLGKEDDISSKKWAAGDHNIFNSEEERREWLNNVLRERQSEMHQVLDKLENKGSDDEDDKILDELEKQWKQIDLEELPKLERMEAESLKKRIEKGLKLDSGKERRSKKTYIQSNSSMNSEVTRKKKENINRKQKQYTKTKKELYDSFVNKI